MEINFIEANETCIAEMISEDIEINNAQDAVDIMMNCIYQGADSLIIRKHNVNADFFDLKTGLAGEILQKFSTYNVRLAIVGDFENIASKSLRDFIYESNKITRINFVNSLDLAREILSR
jgi:hypothetical protein